MQPRLAEPGDVARVARQWAAITDVEDSQELQETIASRLGWWLGDTPSGPGSLAVVEEGATILGVAGWCPKQLLSGGEPILGAEIGTTMTAPQARGRGVFSSLVRFLVAEAERRGVRAIYGTPNAASGAPYVGKLDFKGIWPWVRWIRPLTGPPGLAFDGLGLLRRGAGGFRAEPFTVAPVTDWHELAACWERESRTDVLRVARTADYLRWRYPVERYTAWGASSAGGALLGWVVMGATVRLGRPTMSLVDMAVGPALGAGAGRFLRAAIAAQRQADPGVRVAFAMTSPTSHAGRALRRAGFVGRPSEWPLIARVLAGPESEQQLFGSMSFMAGDSDTV